MGSMIEAHKVRITLLDKIVIGLPLIVILFLGATNVCTFQTTSLIFIGYIIFIMCWMIFRSLNFRDLKEEFLLDINSCKWF